jgi:hypothetical protein
MPFYQCPRCGGTDSYGQWEQRFNSPDITYRDNQNRQVGSSNGGFGVSNVRQQYCQSCMSVKMDLKFSQQDLKVLGTVAKFLIGGSLIYFIFVKVVQFLSGVKNGFYSDSLLGVTEKLSPLFYAVSGTSFLFGCIVLSLMRKVMISREDRKFLKDRFHKPKRQRSKKFFFTWYLVAFITINAIYLSITV